MMRRIVLFPLFAFAIGCGIMPTTPVAETIVSRDTVRDRHSAFDDRVRDLSGDPKSLFSELKQAGFKLAQTPDVGCGIMEHSSPAPGGKTLRASVSYCRNLQNGDVQIDDTDF